MKRFDDCQLLRSLNVEFGGRAEIGIIIGTALLISERTWLMLWLWLAVAASAVLLSAGVSR